MSINELICIGIFLACGYGIVVMFSSLFGGIDE
jgi:hypothetical protein